MISIRINDIDLINSNVNLPNYSNSLYLLFKLQKKIYEASKRCHTSLVHGLQKLLFSLRSFSLLADRIVNDIINQNDNLHLKNGTSFNINTICCKEIKQESKKLLLYWSLDPEWKSRIESNYLISKKAIKYSNIFHGIQRTSCLSYLIYRPIIISKQIEKKYLIRKLQSFEWVNKQILLLLQEDSSINYCYSLDKSISCKMKDKSTILVLLYEILCIGFEWIGMRQIKASLYSYSLYLLILINPINIIFFSSNIKTLKILQVVLEKFLFNLGLRFYTSKKNITNYEISINNITFYSKLHKNILHLKPKPHIKAVKELVCLIRNLLYSKNKQGKLRAKTNLSLEKVILRINTLLLKWYKYFQVIISKLYLSKLTLIVDEIIYRWAKKKYKTARISLVSSINKLF